MGRKVYDTIIPRNVRVSEAPSYGKPVLVYDLKCVGSEAYLRLATEIIQREKELRAEASGQSGPGDPMPPPSQVSSSQVS
jgi:nitrogenase subunit NifH